jgi:hypothetical protein
VSGWYGMSGGTGGGWAVGQGGIDLGCQGGFTPLNADDMPSAARSATSGLAYLLPGSISSPGVIRGRISPKAEPLMTRNRAKGYLPETATPALAPGKHCT